MLKKIPLKILFEFLPKTSKINCQKSILKNCPGNFFSKNVYKIFQKIREFLPKLNENKLSKKNYIEKFCSMKYQRNCQIVIKKKSAEKNCQFFSKKSQKDFCQKILSKNSAKNNFFKKILSKCRGNIKKFCQ